MRPGGGKAKGSAFEREVCERLSLWITAGEKKDCFWRSAMSGGRATIKRGQVRQAGDITAVAEEGYPFTNRFYAECKHVADLSIASFLFKDQGLLADYWRVACREARSHSRLPLLIAKQNRFPILVVASTRLPSRRGRGIIRANWIGSDGNCHLGLFLDLLASDPAAFGARGKIPRNRLD